MAFSPYLDKDTLRAESAWLFTNWQPVLSPSAFDDQLHAVCARVGRHVQWRVGPGDYATQDEMLQAILLEMELVLAQYYLCLATAAIADTSEDPLQNPAASHHQTQHLRDTAEAYKGRCEELMSWWGTLRRDGVQEPASAAGMTFPEGIPQFGASVDWARNS